MPALTSVGTALGLQEIAMERATSDAPVTNNPLLGSVTGIFKDGIVSTAHTNHEPLASHIELA